MEEVKKRRGRPPGSLGKKKLEQLNGAKSNEATRAPTRPKKNKVEVSLADQLNDVVLDLLGGSGAKQPVDEDEVFATAMLDGRFAIKKPPKKKEDKWELGTLVHYFIGDEKMVGWYCGASQAERGCHIVKTKQMIAMMPIDNIKMGH